MSLPAFVSACNATVNPPNTTPNPHGLEPSNAFQMKRVTDAIKAVEVRRMTGNALLGISVVAEPLREFWLTSPLSVARGKHPLL